MTTPAPPPLRLGRYRHYKGRDYLVEGLIRHSETEDWLVLYRPDYGDRQRWVRPYAMFHEPVPGPSGPLPRFQWIADA